MNGLYGGNGPPGPGWSQAYGEGSPDPAVGLRFESKGKPLKISFVKSEFGAFVGVFFHPLFLGSLSVFGSFSLFRVLRGGLLGELEEFPCEGGFLGSPLRVMMPSCEAPVKFAHGCATCPQG